MNHLRNTINRFTQSGTVQVTVLALGSSGFVCGGFVGFISGFHCALTDAVYNRRGYLTTRERIGMSVYTVANLIGQPIVGAIAGTAIGITAPISIPTLCYLYQEAKKKEQEERTAILIEIGKNI
jgi:hypothetical protein